MAKGRVRDRDGIYQRKDRPGTWWGSWIDAKGKRVQRKLEAHTLTQARKILHDERARADEQRRTGIIPVTKDSFAEFAEEFLKYQEKRISPKPTKGRLSKAEYHRQKGIMDSHLTPFFGKIGLALIRRKDVNDYIDSRIGQVSDGTIIKEINVLKRLFNIAIEKEEIIANPTHKASIPKAPEGRNRYLLPEELGRVMKACPEWLRPIAGLAVSLGTRRGELLRVRWQDVNLAAREITLKHTKNGRARPAFINDLAMQVLVSMGAEKHTKDDGKRLLFPGVSPMNVSVAFIRACEDAGIEDFSLHDLRHTFASHARMNGVDLHTLQKLLGHSDPRMTDVYANLSQTFLLDAAKRIDGVLSLAPAAEKRGKKEAERD